MSLQAVQEKKSHNEQIFGDKINCLISVKTNGVSETALHTDIWQKQHGKVFKKHTYCTSLDILSAGFHMISALHVGVR